MCTQDNNENDKTTDFLSKATWNNIFKVERKKSVHLEFYAK
jgi:hypothetical protein